MQYFFFAILTLMFSQNLRAAAPDPYEASDLYIFRDTEDATQKKKKVILLMTVAPHNKLLAPEEVFAADAKYVINTVSPLDPKQTHSIVAFVGADSQYTMFFDEAHQVIAKIGRYGANGDFRAFVGLKSDGRFFDSVGFEKLVASPCRPVFGLRCTVNEFVENGNAGVNVGAIAVSVPIAWLTGGEDEWTGIVRVSGQIYRRVETAVGLE